jgi:predicted adenine nucleotide alpha hydrolase (AANH) superfamily ATPase
MRVQAANGVGEKFLLHSCCAPCSTHVINILKSFDLTVLYFNPNILPEAEYQRRLSEQKRFLAIKNIPMIDFGYDNSAFIQHVLRGREGEREGGERCALCYEMRMNQAADVAKTLGATWFGTTLSVSPHKNADIINNIGRRLQEKYGVRFFAADFKKDDGYKKSVAISHEYGLYRQNYCGCTAPSIDTKIAQNKGVTI